ncbi:hypothetical protein [Alloalcanivorax xenomutans]|uniref:hypothetical protein n=1 Tax=Alloalcanivorax xenomutans TaxID=1094342 RepID=UPI0006D78278|nr:hypothetical protein [Alloalcanivorax xenomutans]PHS60722.1 MAG: hypothetical protein COB00_14880 [Alcanivorax sp.]
MNSLLPTDALVAIALFLTKEVVESVRRFFGHRRTVSAYKRLLAEEAKKNNWVARSLRKSLEELKSDWDNSIVSISLTASGKQRIVIRSKSSRRESSSVLPKVSRNVFMEILSDIAIADRKLFSASTKAYEGVSELEHVRDSIVEYCSGLESESERFREVFLEYAFRKVHEAYESLNELHKHCTGHELEEFKLRSFA